MSEQELAGRGALVTGAASGLGRASAILLAAAGAEVMIADIDESGGRAVVADIEAAGGHARFRYCDVTDRAAVRALSDERSKGGLAACPQGRQPLTHDLQRLLRNRAFGPARAESLAPGGQTRESLLLLCAEGRVAEAHSPLTSLMHDWVQEVPLGASHDAHSAVALDLRAQGLAVFGERS